MGNWIELGITLLWIFAVFVLPGAFIGWLIVRALRWLRDRYYWMRWFSL